MASTMLSVVAPAYCDPSRYEHATLPKPVIIEATDVIIRVYAASVNPVDVKKADGIFKHAVKEQFPYQIGYDVAGVVEAIGSGVGRFKVGDEVFTRLPEANRGAWSEYVKCPEIYIAAKPQNLSFSDAASLPLAGVTALQVLTQYRGSLEGKTVFIPAGLSGTGAYACQLAKNVFRAAKVITTVSTSKISKVAELLGENVVDQVIDYTKQDPLVEVPPRSVDLLFDTTGQSMDFLSLMVPATSSVISISTKPSGTTLQDSSVMQRPDDPRVPLIGRIFLDAGDYLRRVRAWRWGTTYSYWFLKPNGKDLEKLREYVEEGKILPVVGNKVSIRDIQKVRDACGLVFKGKGGLGKTVLEVIQSE